MLVQERAGIRRRGLHAGWRWLGFAALALFVLLAVLVALVVRHGNERLATPPTKAADAALVLGTRTYLDGKPHPCITHRVDRSLELAQAGLVKSLVMTGGLDRKNDRIEAQVMRDYAVTSGYKGVVVSETLARSTRQNLAMAWPLLEAAGAKRVVIVTDPYHLWRVERLARASGFDRAFDVQYAAPSPGCGDHPFLHYKGVLRESLAIVNNALNGYL